MSAGSTASTPEGGSTRPPHPRPSSRGSSEPGSPSTPGEPEGGSAPGSITVVLAFAVNVVIAIAKSVAAGLTGSASMVAEAAHSWADAGNEIFLLVADRRGARGRDAGHPLGYGREAYIWSMFAAFGIFTAGSVVSIFHGVTSLGAEEGETDYLVAYVVLGLAFALEGISFLQALRQARTAGRRIGLHPLRYISQTSNPTLRAVFAEDGAALIGLLLAGGGLLAHQLTGKAVWDAVGSIAVGVLLAGVAFFLISRNREFLLGKEVDDDVTDRALAELLAEPDVDRVTYLHLEFVGPSRLFLVAAVDLTGNRVEDDVARRLRGLESRIEQRDLVEEAVLTLSTTDEVSLRPPDEPGGRRDPGGAAQRP